LAEAAGTKLRGVGARLEALASMYQDLFPRDTVLFDAIDAIGAVDGWP
jgi:hypothetical protein